MIPCRFDAAFRSLILSFALILSFVLSLFASPSDAAVKKQTLTITGYQNQRQTARAVPFPDANRQIEYYESFEPASGVYSGFDNNNHTITGSTVDPDETTVTHSGYGSQVMEVACNSATCNDVVDLGTNYTDVGIKFSYRLTTNPGTSRFAFAALDSSSTAVIRIYAMTGAGVVRVGVYDSAWQGSNDITLSTTKFYTVKIFFLQSSNTTEIRITHSPESDTGNNKEIIGDGIGDDDGKCELGEDCKMVIDTDDDNVCDSTDSCKTGITPGYNNIRYLRFGLNASDTLVEYFDDVAVRNGASPVDLTKAQTWVGDFAAQTLLADSSDNTGWEVKTLDTNTSFDLSDATYIGGEIPLGVRIYERGKNYDSKKVKISPSIVYSTTNVSVNNFEAKPSYEEIFGYWWLNPFNSNLAWDWTYVNGLSWNMRTVPSSQEGCASGGAGTGDVGGIISKGWAEIVYGNSSGDSYVTHGPEVAPLGYNSTSEKSEARVLVRLQPAAEAIIRYGTTEANVKAGYGGDTNISSPVASTTGMDGSTFIDILDLTPSTATRVRYYYDILVKQYNAGTPNPPNEMRYTYSEQGTVAVGSAVQWGTSGCYPSCPGAGTLVNKSAGTAHVRVTTYSQLSSANVVYLDGGNYLTLTANSTHWTSTHLFEGSPYWSDLPSFKTQFVDGFSGQMNISGSGDIHYDFLDPNIYDSIVADDPDLFIQLGDEYATDPEEMDSLAKIRKVAWGHKTWGATGLRYWNLLKHMMVLTVISDHYGVNNSNKLGAGRAFGSGGGEDTAVTWYDTWRTSKAVREVSPYPDLYLPSDYEGTASSGSTTTLYDTSSKERQFSYDNLSGTPNPYCLADATTETCDKVADTVQYSTTACGSDNDCSDCSWDSDTATLLYRDSADSIMILRMTNEVDTALTDNYCVRLSGGGGWSAIVNGSIKNFPDVSRYGIYPGLVVYRSDVVEGATPYGAIVKRNFGNYLEFTAALTNGWSFANGNSYYIKRGGMAWSMLFGNVRLTGLDIRSRRDPNESIGACKYEGSAYGFVSQTASATIPKDIEGDGDRVYNEDVLTAQTGTTTSLIKHAVNNLNSYAVKWDTVGAWSSGGTFRGFALASNITNYPGIIQIGSVQVFTDTGISGSHSITVPSGADIAIVGAVYNINSNNKTFSSLTLGGSAMTGISTGTSYSNKAYEYTTLWYKVNPTSGSQTLAWTWQAALRHGAIFFVVFFDNVDISNPITGSNGIQNARPTGAFNSDVQDVVIGVVGSNSTAQANAGVSGQTQIASNGVFNNATGAMGKKPGVSGTTTFDGTGNVLSIASASLNCAGNVVFGEIALEWAIPNLQATDQIRLFESGGSTYPTDKANINHGHVQRTWVKNELSNEDEWGIPLSETPFGPFEIANYDKWEDVSGDTKLAESSSSSAWDIGTDPPYAIYPSGSTLPEKPGAVYGFSPVIRTPVYEVQNKTDLDATAAGNEWWWNSATSQVYVNATGLNLNQAWQFYRANFWDYVAIRRFMLGDFGTRNKIIFGADRHWPALHYSPTVIDPWAYIGASPLHVNANESQSSARKWRVLQGGVEKISYYQYGMGGYSDFGTGNANGVCESGENCCAAKIGGYAYLEVNRAGTPTIRVTMKERDGSTIDLWQALTGDPVLGCANPDDCKANWLHYLAMDIDFRHLEYIDDSVSISDEATALKLREILDSMTISDQILLPMRNILMSDSVGLSDAVFANKQLIVSESLGIIDNILRNKTLTVNDLLTLADAVEVAKYIFKEINDSISLSDAILTNKTFSVFDTFNLNDYILRDKSLLLSDSMDISDSILRNKSFSLSDNMTILDSIYRNKSFSIADEAGISDYIYRDKTLQIIETVQIIESVLANKTLTIADLIAIADSAEKIGEIIKQVLDTMSISDAVLVNKNITIPDIIALADSVLAHKILNVNDQAALSDAVKTLKTFVISDSIAITDQIEVAMTAIKEILDTVSLTDAVMTHKILNVSDTVALYEIASTIAKDLIITDQISMIDFVLALKTMVITDQMSITDAVELLGQVITILGSEVPPRSFGADATKRIFETDVPARTFGSTVPARRK